MGAVDKADDQVEKLFAREHQTRFSPVHRAVWDRSLPLELFESAPVVTPPQVQRVMDASRAAALAHRTAGTIYGPDGKLSDAVIGDLAAAGYWGLLVNPAYGGSGAPFRAFSAFLTWMALVDPTAAGLASVHGCIGAVDPLRTFGTGEQKQRRLPELASGRRLSAFALTEPGAGSDLTALKTRAVRDGDRFLVTGEKLFITNVAPGRTIGLVCLVDDKPAVLIVDLPEHESEQFQIVHYGLHALKHLQNRGLKFVNFPVPAADLLTPPVGNGLTIAYHGLNLGRVALCANAAGTMRILLASMLPWAKFRRTYGEAIERRELVRRRIARLAGLIVGADALVAWCSTLLDQGYRGEIECIIAKVFGSEALKEAAVELCMKTHGGRSFLHGHLFGDHVHDYLAPCIYEGEGEMLGLALFKALVKQHGQTFFEPVGKALHAAGLKKLNPSNPLQLWRLRSALAPYAKWMAGERFARKSRTPSATKLPPELAGHVDFACRELQRMPLAIDRTLRKHQLKLADRQCRMAELSARVQKLVIMLCTALYAAGKADALTRRAADVLCRDLEMELTRRPRDDRYFRAVNELGAAIAEQGWEEIDEAPAPEVLQGYAT